MNKNEKGYVGYYLCYKCGDFHVLHTAKSERNKKCGWCGGKIRCLSGVSDEERDKEIIEEVRREDELIAAIDSIGR